MWNRINVCVCVGVRWLTAWCRPLAGPVWSRASATGSAREGRLASYHWQQPQYPQTLDNGSSTASITVSLSVHPSLALPLGVGSSWACGTPTPQWGTSWGPWSPAPTCPPTGACPSSCPASSSPQWAWSASFSSSSVRTATAYCLELGGRARRGACCGGWVLWSLLEVVDEESKAAE